MLGSEPRKESLKDAMEAIYPELLVKLNEVTSIGINWGEL